VSTRQYIVNLNQLQDISTFSPPLHTKTTERKLIDETKGARNFALWHGEVGPGGMVELHVHEEMEKAIIILDGECLFKLDDQEYRLGKGDIVFVPPKYPHQLSTVGTTTLKTLVIMAPPPASLKEWHKI